ncbi:putative bifunctional diguanylate cyclase/phosphodiesterase [Ketobacter nezhaii]|uniref:putative bifunctional diguanylate cyclase/phosphodiesterase n=1 Tax=Ketobacter sp. MCCC 1A13808 TaxID=2602738 RepID=UPI0018DCC65E|nr:bifunctional diguanylate cyclase/phosphodiesterase [Ketobacter sp. MCCC 1A13808]
MAAKPLRARILKFVIGPLLAVTLAFGISVWVSTSHHARVQIESDLNVAESVLKQMLQSREQQLVSSAEVLTADFGFKQAAASADEATIKSALLNQGNRIGADLMALLSLQGDLIASNLDAEVVGFDTADVVERTLNHGGLTRHLYLNGKLYQVILLPVKAPVAIAVAMIGFEINQALANELKALTLQDVSFVSVGVPSITTLPAESLAGVVSHAAKSGEPIALPILVRPQFASRYFPLNDGGRDPITVYLSASVSDAFKNFDLLQLEIIAIAMVACLLALLGSAVMARNLAKPLSRLARTASDIAAGDYRKNVEIESGVTEILELSDAFNSMQIDLAEREARIVHQAHHDPLTNLINRQYIITLLRDALDGAGNDNFAVICLNILDFRVVNDTFGHVVGDQCLQQIGQRLMNLPVSNCLAARLGGDEFLVALNLDCSLERAAEYLLEALSQPYNIHSLEITLRFSMGAALAPKDSTQADELVQKASIALDMARREQLSMAIYEQQLEEEHLTRLRLLADLKTALADNDGQLQMHYQPKIFSSTMQATRFEALIRWIHPQQGFVPPDLFIPFAEQAGLIGAVTDWVVEAVVIQIAQWHQQGFNAQVAINLSAKDLSRPHLLDHINRLLVQNQLPANSLSFEITESEIMRDPEEANQLLLKFRKNGFELAIDDFGTGYSSLSQLKHMPVTELKIDKSFVLQLANLENDKIIVQSTISLAHSFNLKVVAEGVEDEASLALLRSWGCDWIQGFFISKPLPAKEVLPWVNNYSQSIDPTLQRATTQGLKKTGL